MSAEGEGEEIPSAIEPVPVLREAHLETAETGFDAERSMMR
jgi:hypothetical protein